MLSKTAAMPSPGIYWSNEYKTFSQLLNRFSERHNRAGAFQDFMEITIACLPPRWVDERGQNVGRFEEEYLQAIRGYSKKELGLAGDALGALFLLYDKFVTPCGGWADPLGDYLQMEIGSKKSKQWTGEFFTPPAICSLMSAIVAADPDKKREAIRNSSVLDPTCGSSRTLIDFDRTCGPGSFNFYVGSDLQRTCVLASVINFVMHGLRGVVIHADTLRVEAFGGYRIWAPETGIGVTKLTKEEAMKYIVSVKKAVKNPNDDTLDVLSKSATKTKEKQPQTIQMNGGEQLVLF